MRNAGGARGKPKRKTRQFKAEGQLCAPRLCCLRHMCGDNPSADFVVSSPQGEVARHGRAGGVHLPRYLRHMCGVTPQSLRNSSPKWAPNLASPLGEELKEGFTCLPFRGGGEARPSRRGSLVALSASYVRGNPSPSKSGLFYLTCLKHSRHKTFCGRLVLITFLSASSPPRGRARRQNRHLFRQKNRPASSRVFFRDLKSCHACPYARLRRHIHRVRP